MNINRLFNIIPSRFRKLEYLYSVLALFFGLIFVAIIPPGWNPDEPQHYWRVQSLAHGNVFADIYHGNNTSTYAGGPLATNTSQFINSYGGTANPAWPNYQLNFPMTDNKGVFVHEKDTGETIPTIFSATSKNTPFVYLPYVIGTWIGNTLGLPLLTSFIFAKILGLITQVLAFFYAIRIIPKAKWLVAIIGLLPTLVVQSAAITADVMTISVCVLFIAFVIRETFSKKPISKISFGIIFALVAALALVKASYLPIAALLLLIPIVRKEYRGLKTLILFAVIAALCAIPGLLWLRSVLSIPDYYQGNVIPSEQITHIIHNPIGFIQVVYNTYFSDSQQIIHRGVFGSFIWDTVALPLIFNFAGVIAITLSLLISSRREKITISFSIISKVLMWAIFATLVGLITYALYIYYTPVGDHSARGIQGRYFLPFALLPLLTLHKALPSTPYQTRLKIIACLLATAMLTASTVVIFERIYA